MRTRKELQLVVSRVQQVANQPNLLPSGSQQLKAQ